MITVQPPLEYLITSSQAGLESFEHSRLWRCGNLRKELRDLFEECIEAEMQARMHGGFWNADEIKTQVGMQMKT